MPLMDRYRVRQGTQILYFCGLCPETAVDYVRSIVEDKPERVVLESGWRTRRVFACWHLEEALTGRCFCAGHAVDQVKRFLPDTPRRFHGAGGSAAPVESCL